VSGEGEFKPFNSGSVPRYQEIATFMRAARAEIAPPLEIALAGVPLDLGATYRVGARHGPAAVREASRLIRQINPATGVAPFHLCRVGDVGDAPTDPLDVVRSVALIQGFFERIHAAGAAPVVMGGDHTVPLPVLRAIAHEHPVGLIQFDAHGDVFDEFMGSRINHATFVRRGIEEGLIEPTRSVQIGLRGTRYGTDDLDYSHAAGIRVVTIDDYEQLGRDQVIAAIRNAVGAGPAYVTFDVDGLDPAAAPGTGVPEPGGLTMRDSQVMLRALTGLAVIGGDVCEVAPPLDPTGITCINAANLMFEILCLVAAGKAARRPG
jgi:guanidinopropionase